MERTRWFAYEQGYESLNVPARALADFMGGSTFSMREKAEGEGSDHLIRVLDAATREPVRGVR